MNLSKFLPTLLGCLLSLTLANFGFAKDSSEIAWSEDLVATMELAQRTGKPVLVHFYGDHCPPCRMLEKKAFKDPQLIQAIGEHVLAVRINAERDTKIAARFRVNRWPTDVYLHPNGDEIYRNISAQDPAAYERTVMKVAEKNQRLIGQLKSKPFEPTRSDLMAAELKAAEPANEAMESNKGVRVSLASSQSTTAPASSPVVASLKGPARVRLSEAAISSVDTADVAINNQSPLPTPPTTSLQDQQPLVVEAPVPSVEVPSVEVPSVEVPSVEVPSVEVPSVEVPLPAAPSLPLTAEPQTTEQIAQPTKVEPSLPTAVAMGGFCPVSLAMAIEASKTGATSSPAWVQGHGDFAVRHRGRVYHCVSEEALSKFLESPDLYAPVLSGCDLVEYSKSGKWIDGDCRFGFIDKETGRIFLFSSSLNCQEFAQNCESYSSMVGKPAQR
ncbi:MAG: thioredoxin family protein [Planctomycetaceae bacterium]|nr:thioredoxin family protein [Planctomycetaceae bacterium]